MKNNRIFALGFRLTAFVLGIVGIIMIFSISDKIGIMFIYFTIQTNIFIAVLFGVLSVLTIIQIRKDGRHGEVAHINLSLQLAVIFFITITGIVYATMLSWVDFSMAEASLTKIVIGKIGNILVHYVVPIMALVDWIIFMPHGKLKLYHAFIWLIYPAVYDTFVMIRGTFGEPIRVSADGVASYYPYPFIEVTTLGWPKVAGITAAMVLGFAALGLLMIYIDRALAKRQKNSLKACQND